MATELQKHLRGNKADVLTDLVAGEIGIAEDTNTAIAMFDNGSTTIELVSLERLDDTGVGVSGAALIGVDETSLSTLSGSDVQAIIEDIDTNITAIPVLTDTDYILVDGSRELTANWGVGGFDLDNVGSVTIAAGSDLILSSTSSILVNTDKFTVDGSNGNTTIDGTLNIGSTTAISAILDEDDLVSDSNTSLATQQSIKAYVDAQFAGGDLDIAGDSGTGNVVLLTQTLTLAGTANEIETSTSGQTITIGLPDNVSITDTLGAGGLITASGGLTTAGGDVTLGSGDDLLLSTTSDINVGSGNFTVAGATGNTSQAGTQTFTGGTQNYEFSQTTILFNLQSKATGTANRFRLFTAEGDGTDHTKIYLYGVGTPSATTNSEYMEMGWNTSDSNYIIHSNATGTGTTRPIHIYTGINTTQLVLNIDGSTDFGGLITANLGLTTSGGNLTLGAGDDLIGSLTSDINFGSGAFFWDSGNNILEIERGGGGILRISTPAVTAQNDTIGRLDFYSNDGSVSSSGVFGRVSLKNEYIDSWTGGVGRVDTYMDFMVSQNANLFEAMRINSSGILTSNYGVTLAANADLIGSSTSEINFGSGNFTVAGATGNTAVGGTLTMTGASQDYELSLSTTILDLQSKTTGFSSRVRLFTNDGDGTDDLRFYLYGVGTPASVTNSEYMEMAWAESPAYYIIHSFATGTGTTRPIHLYTGINSEQLVLNTDGSTDVGGRLTLHHEFGWDPDSEINLGAGQTSAANAATGRDDIGDVSVVIVEPTVGNEYYGFDGSTNRTHFVVLNHGCTDAYIVEEGGDPVAAQIPLGYRCDFSYQTGPGFGYYPSLNVHTP